MHCKKTTVETCWPAQLVCEWNKIKTSHSEKKRVKKKRREGRGKKREEKRERRERR